MSFMSMAGALRADGAAMVRAAVVAHDPTTVWVRPEGSEPQAAAVPCDVLWPGSSPEPLATGDVVLVCPGGDATSRGVVLGRIGPPASAALASAAPPNAETAPQRDPPDELVLEAKQNLTLKCGDGSITIRADGRILIKGKDLVSHAQRTNRIKGGSVAIN